MEEGIPQGSEVDRNDVLDRFLVVQGIGADSEAAAAARERILTCDLNEFEEIAGALEGLEASLDVASEDLQGGVPGVLTEDEIYGR